MSTTSVAKYALQNPTSPLKQHTIYNTQAVKMARFGRQTVSNTGSSQSRRGQVTMK